MQRALLVHGLGRSPLSMSPLANPLRLAGYRPRFFGYVAAVEPLPRIISRLTRTLKEIQPEVVVGHSLGGILLRLALAECPTLAIKHFFMLGTPNQSPRAARYFWGWRPFRLVSSTCGEFLVSPSAYEQLPKPKVPYTIYAGVKGWPRWFDPFRGEPNDRIVAVSETVIDPAHPPIIVSAEHSLMTYSQAIHEQITKQLRSGNL